MKTEPGTGFGPSRTDQRGFSLVLVAGLAAITAGCLPEGKPTIGQHLIEARGIEYLAFAPDADGEPGTNAVYTVQSAAEASAVPTGNTGDAGYPADLYAVPTTGGAARQLATGIEPLVTFGFPTDARRRLLFGSMPIDVSPDPAAMLDVSTVNAVDVITGDVTSFGSDIFGVLLSTSGQWALVYRNQPDQHFDAVSLDGTAARLDVRVTDGQFDYPQFAGDRLYFVNPANQLVRFDAGVLTTIADGFPTDNSQSWQVVALTTADVLVRQTHPSDTSTPDGTTLTWQILADAAAAGAPRSGSLMGPSVGASPPSPDGTEIAFVATRSDGTETVHLLDLSGGTTAPVEDTVDLPPAADGDGFWGAGGFTWRKGTSELWLLDNGLRPAIWRRGQPAFTSDRMLAGPWAITSYGSSSTPSYGAGSFFLDDDSRFLFYDANMDPWIGDASDPQQGPATRLATSNRFINDAAVLVSGKRLAIQVADHDTGADLYTVDLSDGTMHLLASHVVQTLYGPNRILAISQALKNGGAGNLSLFDATTGAETVLAQSVTLLASARPCPACSPLDQGARVLFTVQGRYPYEQDGIWGGTLP